MTVFCGELAWKCEMLAEYPDVFRSLKGLRKISNEWQAKCPAHEDDHQSLTLRISPQTGKLLLHCHAGCTLNAICDHLGVDRKYLFPPDSRRQAMSDQVFSYEGADGTLLYQVVRKEPKKFSQRKPDGEGGFEYSMDGVERVLYNLPAIKNSGDRAVFVVEGEKDAERLKAAQLVATTNVGGAGKWRPEYAETLRGRSVIVIPDNDEPGKVHAEKVCESLKGVAKEVAVVDLGLKEKSQDVSDWLDAGHSIKELKQLAKDAWNAASGNAAPAPHGVVLTVEQILALGFLSWAPKDDAIQNKAWQRLVDFCKAGGLLE